MAATSPFLAFSSKGVLLGFLDKGFDRVLLQTTYDRTAMETAARTAPAVLSTAIVQRSGETRESN